MWRFVRQLIRKILLLEEKILCDTCRYDYPGACKRPERPNAVECPDYKKSGDAD